MPTEKINNKSLITFINPFSYYTIRRHHSGDLILKNFDINYDGISLVAIDNLLFFNNTKRSSFDDTSLAPIVLKAVSEKNLKLGIIGSSRETILKAKRIIEAKYGINIKHTRDGYFKENELSQILEEFKECEIVITSMGTPLQEDFLLSLKQSGWNGTGFTCGGYFDQLASSNGLNYYPPLIDKLHMRWLYRIYKEPRRLWKRYLVYYPLGIIYFVFDRLTRQN
ncbi:WecB/TagA/CpsF family glycosyltransferase [Pseudomonas sp. PDM19]|uniref:WecB/TagA/CpsF family glycosyltransferase n=1 Tax=Pseudomonas sp. PDM19 TaxID=2769272 RepID=UPI001784FE3C|nr:WecB/TagA/CpsF family glycosyltransferase [Pseudomonas sp. PDM19]MBD9632586.1 WecB/TagA/CpsF family glycosyltransferase [Pseudomonas sp. PDM19]